jgi:hypothetical protein
MGQWALHFGASTYVGVEAQQSFCTRAKQLLAHWNATADGTSENGAVEIVCSGVREYLRSCADKSVDVVVNAGVLHSFLDPEVIVMEMIRVARHAVVIESNHPELVQSGVLSDDVPVSLLHDRALINLANTQPLNLPQGATQPPTTASIKHSSLEGLACTPSLALLTRIFDRAGFNAEVITPEYSTAIDTRVYTAVAPGSRTPSRYTHTLIHTHIHFQVH